MAFFSLTNVDKGRCQRKQMKSIDQIALQIGYEGIKSLRPLIMKNYLVTGGLSSLVESCNNFQKLLLRSSVVMGDSQIGRLFTV